MAISANDIHFRYSGGLFNSNPAASLGGSMSSIAILSGSLNNLFGDVTQRNTSITNVDYRALYIVNTSTTDSLFNIRIIVTDVDNDGTAIMRIGTVLSDELQTVSIPNESTVLSGSFALKFGQETTGTINWSSDINTMSNDIQTALRNLNALSDVIVTGNSSGDNRVFNVSFVNADGKRLQPILSDVNTDIKTTEGLGSIIVNATQRGSPINGIAIDIAFANNAPAGISFTAPQFFSPISIGKLAPQETMYLWFQRTILPSANQTLSEDSFNLRISGFSQK